MTTNHDAAPTGHSPEADSLATLKAEILTLLAEKRTAALTDQPRHLPTMGEVKVLFTRGDLEELQKLRNSLR